MEDNILIQSPVDTAIQSHAPDFNRTVVPEDEPFLNFDLKSELLFEYKSTIYHSLVTLVKAEYPFDDALQDRAVRFMKSLEPKWGRQDQAKQLVTDLVPSSAGSDSGFLESILTLLSSPNTTVVAAALSFIRETTNKTVALQFRFVASDIISNVFTTVQPHTLPITGSEDIFNNLNMLINCCLNLATPYFVRELGITEAINAFNHREMIFQKVVLPSSHFVTFLSSNQHFFNGQLFDLFMDLLYALLRISPFHRPTLEFVLASPIAMTFSSCLSFIEDEFNISVTLKNINDSLFEWKNEGPEVIRNVKLIVRALISEGFEDTLEQKMMSEKSGDYGHYLVNDCLNISKLLGSN
ncbi:hypothetical protein BLNAU_5014 [Blattamonas nauphoetae]|uniref:Uncharacterized protein n=1 Tax=Blattamonas nauphoetae TaxID=2049346 RepID=A0ABQ9Y8N5_9EUKA|nr:hypothetical protein BLNAU_5014 [Blattamonas nauphoetae]